jgi:hypothetical protein
MVSSPTPYARPTPRRDFRKIWEVEEDIDDTTILYLCLSLYNIVAM